MSGILDAFRAFSAWWHEGLAKFGQQALHVYDLPDTGATDSDAEAEREAWEEERVRLALSPWWM